MTTIIMQRPSGPSLSKPQINNIFMFIAALGIAAMIIATQPFSSGASPGSADRLFSPSSFVADQAPLKADWCCLGSKPAEALGRGMTDVGEVTGSVDNSPRMNPLAVRLVGNDPGAIDVLIGGTASPGSSHTSNRG